MTVALPAVGRIDCEQPDVRAVITLDGRDHTHRRVTTDERRLFGSEQRKLELVRGRRSDHGPLAERGERVEGTAVEDGQGGHGAVTVPGMEVRRRSWQRARSRFCSGRRMR